MARKLIVEILGDSKSLERSFDRSSKAAKQFEQTTVPAVGRVDGAFKKIQGIRAGAFVGGTAAVAAVAGIKKVTDAASDQAEQISKNRQVFDQSAASVQAWAETTAKSIGISETAALGATGTFGNLFAAIGTAPAEAAKTSTALVKLAADLASFNNASPEEVLDAIRSGLVGEAEPLRRYGVLLSEARVQQVALAETGKTNVKSLTDQEKAAARVAIIFRDTSQAQGDFERTSGGLANQQRILNAEVQDLEASLGKLLLPTITELTGVLVDATDSSLTLLNALKKLGSVKIPPIEIPFITKQVPGTGGTVGDVLGDVLGKAGKALTFTGPLAPITISAATIKRIAAQFEEGTAGATPELARNFEQSLNAMFTNAINDALSNAKPDTSKVKGFGTGLTPKDLFGPLIKQLPNKFTEGIVDAELAGKGIRDAHVAARDRLVKASHDPRLLAADRIKLKEAVKAERDAIKAIDDDVAAGLKKTDDDRKARIAKAARDRQDRIDKAAQAAREAVAKQRAGFDNLFSLLQLNFDKAEISKAFKDDVEKSRSLERAIENQIKVEGRTPELLDRLFRQRQTTADKIREERQAQQFRALGLSETGDEITPGFKNLETRLKATLDKIGSGELKLSSKLSAHLKSALKSVVKDGKNLTDATRKQINEWIRAANGEGADKLEGPLTATTSLNVNKFLEGLGVDRDTAKEIRARLSGVNSARVQLAGNTRPTGGFVTPQPIQVVNHNTISLDGKTVATSITKSQQKEIRRNPPNKRGSRG